MRPEAGQLRFALGIAIVVAVAMSGGKARAQAGGHPSDALSNPYRTVMNWAQLPDGRKRGLRSGVSVDRDGTIWTYDRCGGNSCTGSSLDPILEFEPSGKLL